MVVVEEGDGRIGEWGCYRRKGMSKRDIHEQKIKELERNTYTTVPTMLLGMPHGATELIVVVIIAALVTAACTHVNHVSPADLSLMVLFAP